MTVDAILEAMEVLLEPESVAELRILNAPGQGTMSGYFDADHRQELAAAAASWSGKGGIYITPNPVDPTLLARSANRLTHHAKNTTTDADILRRRWLLIDVDPVRPSGISATEVEHELAIARAREITGWLIQQGWPPPLLADSGNGAHVLARVDLPNTPESTNLVRMILAALAFRFDDDAVIVDQTTSNAARIWKVYGTLAVKGDNMPDRPYRLARLLEVPIE